MVTERYLKSCLEEIDKQLEVCRAYGNRVDLIDLEIEKKLILFLLGCCKVFRRSVVKNLKIEVNMNKVYSIGEEFVSEENDLEYKIPKNDEEVYAFDRWDEKYKKVFYRSDSNRFFGDGPYPINRMYKWKYHHEEK